MGRSKGYSLVELMVAIAVVALITLLAVPKLRSASYRSNVRNARHTIIAMLEQAKLRAIHDSRSAALKVSGTGVVWITASPRRSAGAAACGCDTIALRNLQQLYGVTVSPSSTSDSSFAFDPRGLSVNRGGAPMTVRVTHAEFKDSVMITGFGDVAK